MIYAHLFTLDKISPGVWRGQSGYLDERNYHLFCSSSHLRDHSVPINVVLTFLKSGQGFYWTLAEITQNHTYLIWIETSELSLL